MFLLHLISPKMDPWAASTCPQLCGLATHVPTLTERQKERTKRAVFCSVWRCSLSERET